MVRQPGGGQPGGPGDGSGAFHGGAGRRDDLLREAGPPFRCGYRRRY